MTNLPATSLLVAEAKLTGYLLNPEHPVGRFKSAFFLGIGFTIDNPLLLKNALLEHALEGDIVLSTESLFGVKLKVKGPFKAPTGKICNLTSIWLRNSEADFVNFITAYPS